MDQDMSFEPPRENTHLPGSHETGTLGIPHLKRLWSARKAELLHRQRDDRSQAEKHLDITLLDLLELSVADTYTFLSSGSSSFERFESWIADRHPGGLPEELIASINRATDKCLAEIQTDYPLATEIEDPVLTRDDLEFWDKNGYVVVKQAIPEEDCINSVNAIWQRLEMSPDNPEAWTSGRTLFWLTEFDHELFRKNRGSKRIHKAFAQIWGTRELVLSAHRVSFNPPQPAEVTQYGPSRLHWDASIAQPMPFDVIGLLYLNEVRQEQGAFQCIPGFHHRIDAWLSGLPKGASPRDEILQEPGGIKVPGKAGDLIICRQEIPHGSSVNRGSFPRFVQYIAMYPSDRRLNPIWQ